ncbi:MAG: 50S ribosomal protein L10 [Kiritimatiellae bacterium]|jgi:large subunit ribosomal protein L10|nr:50S ribosomal protein L10 [Kiritimatiellia bacterium]MDY0148636.1 50S ribosomal protein L10 [Kiritimatiellia bacterium]
MRPEKQAIVKEIQDSLADTSFVILTDFTGMDMAKTAALRRALKETQARFQVVPNRLFRVAAAELGYEGIESGLKGPTALVSGTEDVAGTAKILREFAKQNKVPVVKLGRLDGELLQAAEIETLATLPPKTVMQGMLVGTIAAPMSNLVGVMSQKLASLLYVLKAAGDKKNAA